jgi:hypothetical protein
MTEERKFTTGFGKEVKSDSELLGEMPASMKDWMKLKQGEFTHEIHRNGAVIISPKQDENTAIDPSIPQDQEPV